jgi:pilus assembly protein CpaD
MGHLRQYFRRARTAFAAGACVVLAGCGGGPFDEPAVLQPDFVALAPDACADRLGCATDRNIAAMLDRPADLAMARRARPRDAIRREVVISAYRGEAPGGTGPEEGARR